MRRHKFFLPAKYKKISNEHIVVNTKKFIGSYKKLDLNIRQNAYFSINIDKNSKYFYRTSFYLFCLHSGSSRFVVTNMCKLSRISIKEHFAEGFGCGIYRSS